MAKTAQSVLRHDIVEIFEATALMDSAMSIKEIIRQLRARIQNYGYVACLITNLPNPSTGALDEHILVNGWPADWYNHYMTAKHYRHDPCAALCRTAMAPFLWSDVSRGRTDANARRVMDEAAEFGLRQGICIPIQCPSGENAAVTLAGSELDLTPSARCTVHALARHAYSAAHRLVGGLRKHKQRLSKRECEILQWVAAGKTAWEVSRILCISACTVNTHLRNVRQKLDTANIVQAIVEAVRRHEIQL
ncbi:LuxR family transcriptional regulator [Mesorhizobium sp. M7D.F.Ca.US.005.01.1.1]|jgi:LuxR family transcriptional regulator, quorum-sensing system regulator BjaR1|uniref:LuxR family quorum sensing-dependent transcriptional regulator n=1 Tax=Rhizobium loti TaxID=381 RepID=A0A8E2W7N8_RHILI|nr:MULTISPECIES: LuxR family transcriptional regulator [Mesorhizobium]AZO41410.1 LuxR family transcriptional regulator [Mesorhizobium sp. M7D.F.Ca.US.005.01.1.1]PWJ88032.1 LuxR family quorum sensing-dependent transcriptional regulator [Mesorhizobium loti]